MELKVFCNRLPAVACKRIPLPKTLRLMKLFFTSERCWNFPGLEQSRISNGDTFR